MGWFCVHIEHLRVAKAVNTTFLAMLIDEHRDIGRPRDCHVYHASTPDGDFYYFPPTAGKVLAGFLKFWQGVAVPEPALWNQMEKVL